EVSLVKSITQVLCCAAAALLAGRVCAATSEPTLADPAAGVSAALDAAPTNPAAEPTPAAPFPAVVSKERTTRAATAPASAGSAVGEPCGDSGDSCGNCGDPCGCSSCVGDCCGCGSGVLGFLGPGCDGASRWMASAGAVILSRSQPVPSIIADPIA